MPQELLSMNVIPVTQRIATQAECNVYLAWKLMEAARAGNALGVSSGHNCPADSTAPKQNTL